MFSLRLTEYPTAVPHAIGKRIAAAGLEKSTAGSVREGMKVVMFAFALRLKGRVSEGGSDVYE